MSPQNVYTYFMRFEWDEDKRASNLAKHGLDFKDAPDIFQGFMLKRRDTRKDYQEERVYALGELCGVVVVVVYTVREEKHRIISMRKANQRERRVYEKAKNENLF